MGNGLVGLGYAGAQLRSGGATFECSGICQWQKTAWSGATAAARFLVFGLLPCGCSFPWACAMPWQPAQRAMPEACKCTAEGGLAQSVHMTVRVLGGFLPWCSHRGLSWLPGWFLGLPRGQGRGSGQGLRRLAPVNVHTCGAGAGQICRVAWHLCGPWLVLQWWGCCVCV